MQLDRRSWAAKAQEHLACAEALLGAEHFANAYYLAGLAVECGLKACIARRFASETWPDRDFVNRIHTHSLPALVALAGLDRQRGLEEARNQAFRSAWSLVKTWSVTARYGTATKPEADLMVDAVAAEDYGVLPWIARHW